MNVSSFSVKSTDSKVEEFCREIYAAEDYEKSLSAILQVQSFRHLVGWKSTQLQDRWLSYIPVNSVLNAFSQGVSQLYHKFESLSREEILLICNLVVESDNYDNELLDKLVLKVINFNDIRISRFLIKIVKKLVAGKVVLPAATVVSIFKKEETLLLNCLKELKGKTGNQLENTWLMKECLSNSDLYLQVSKVIENQYPSFLPIFTHSTSLSCSTMKFYPPNEQPCIILAVLPSGLDSKMKDAHVSKVMHEVLQLWLSNPKSVHKLLAHFPQLTEWLMEYCDRDVNAQRLCLHFISIAQVPE